MAFLVAATVIILGFIGEEFSKRTGVPDPVLLLLFGVLLGSIFQVFGRVELLSVTPYFAALALIIILFDGGLNMNLQQAIKSSPRALVLAVFGWFLTVLVTSVLCKVLLGWRFLNGLLLGSIVGGSSSIIVINLARKLDIKEETTTILSLESTLTDVLCTVGTFVIIDIILSGTISLESALSSVITVFGVGIVLGAVFGIAWLVILERIHTKPNAYMLTLAVLFLTFVAARNFGGTGALSALFLGLMIGNRPAIAKVLKFKTTVSFEESVGAFHGQISFLTRSFFFFFTGLLFSFTSPTFIFFGVFLSFVFLGLRVIVVELSTFKSHARENKALMMVMLPRGLAAAVLASLPLTAGVSDAEAFPEIVFMVILTTILVCTLGTAILKRR